MKHETCESMAEQLVEYVDGELPAGQRSAVAEHVRQCVQCRATVEALRRSLGLAKVVWQDAAEQMESHGAELPAGIARSARRRRWMVRFAPLATAAGILLLLLGLLIWQAVREGNRQPVIAQSDTPTRPALPATADPAQEYAQAPAPEGSPLLLSPEALLAQVEFDAARAAGSAALLASTDHLARQPGCEEIARGQYAFIADTYADTQTAEAARQRLESLPERRALQ